MKTGLYTERLQTDKTESIFLFIIRLFFYFSVMALIFIHPDITVPFDRIGILQWFVIIPVMALIAFLPRPASLNEKQARLACPIAALSLIPLSIWAGGFGPAAVQPFFAGIVSFSLTWLLFRQPRSFFPNIAKAAVFEPFFLAWICLRLLSLSRSSEDAAQQSAGLTRFILVWTAVVFLFHSVIVYFCLFPKSFTKVKNEGMVLMLAALASLILVTAVLPSNFIRNTIIENLIPERMPERLREDSDRGIQKDSRGRRDGRRTLPRDGDGRQGELRGISEYYWQNSTGRGRSGDGSSDNRQYLVMIVAADREPLYMGDSFRGQLDPVKGFLLSIDEPVNRLTGQRFFVTWFSSEQEFDIGRRRQEVFSLSTLTQKYLPYRPVSIDPTILNEDAGPLRYIHQVVSNTHFGDPLRLVNTPSRPFNSYEEIELAPYFEIPLYKNDIEVFNNWLTAAQENWRNNREALIKNNSYLWEIFSVRAENMEPVNEYLETILALLTGFSEYQYNLNYDDDYSIDTLKEFILNSAQGDCVEFSNTLALLGRLAGIPSRVVTGYLAAESLQTQAHIRGLANLRSKVEVLQKFPLDNLFMVTNLHSHSWTQFYIPDYGWLDFEATAFSLPPAGNGDFNTWDVVIPLIDEERFFSSVRKFPWQAVLRAAGFFACFALAGAYVLRYGREIFLYFCARAESRAGARSLYLLLLSRLAADGKPIKPASKTAMEYSQLFHGAIENPHLSAFASLYTELRWRDFSLVEAGGGKSQMEERFRLLRQEYRRILNTARRKGIKYRLIRIVSLRGLAYL